MMSKNPRPLLRAAALSAALLISASATAFAQADAAPATPPPRSWIDPDTGHRVIRLTDEPGSASLYFNDNSITPDGKKLVYLTPSGLSAVDLTTFQSRQLLAGHVQTIVAGRKNPTV